MKKICLLLAVLICIASLLVGCTDKQGTEKLRNDFIGETFVGGHSDSTGSYQYEIRSRTVYRFVFADEDTVSLTRTVTKKYGGAYNKSDTEEENTENLAYAVKKRNLANHIFSYKDLVAMEKIPLKMTKG